MTKPQAHHRSHYRVFRDIQTRWMDNDMYGHINNVVYYSWFDTAVNAWLVEQGVLDPLHDKCIGMVVETGCNYFASLAFPEAVEVGLCVAYLGKTSVRYEIGLFAKGAETAAAQGHFVHVYVERTSQRPTPLPASVRTLLESARVSGRD